MSEIVYRCRTCGRVIAYEINGVIRAKCKDCKAWKEIEERGENNDLSKADHDDQGTYETWISGGLSEKAICQTGAKNGVESGNIFQQRHSV